MESMGQSSKELVRNLLNLKEVSGIPFIPWVCSFAAQLEQIHVEEMLSDPGLLSSSLLNAQELFAYDAIVNIFDPSLEAEACGCEVEWGQDESLPRVVSHPLQEGATTDSIDLGSLDKRGRVPVVLEATKRMILIRGKQVAVIGVTTGPVTLATHLAGESLVNDLNEGSEEAVKIIGACAGIALALCRKYGELGVDAVAIADDMLAHVRPDRYSALASPLRSIWNVLKFYGVRSLLVSRSNDPEAVPRALGLQADGLSLGGAVNPSLIKDAAVERKSCYGVPLPTAALVGSPTDAADMARNCLSVKGKGFFLSTDWEVPYAANVGAMHEIMSVIRGQQ